MIFGPASKEKLQEWREIHKQYKDVLAPNRKSGQEVLDYLRAKYALEETKDENSLSVVYNNVMLNDFHKQKLPSGLKPEPKTFILKNEGNGRAIYESREDLWGNCPVFIGIDLTSGFVQIEGSCCLYDEIFAFQGVDAFDIENCVRVADYINCIKKFNPELYNNLSNH